MRQWSCEAGHTVIGVMHDINLALRLTDHVLFLKDGRIAGMGRAEEIMTRPFLQQVYDMDVWQYMHESYQQWAQMDNAEDGLKGL